MLSRAGFEVTPSTIPLDTEQLYNETVDPEVHTFRQHIFLVTCNGPKTDSWAGESRDRGIRGSFTSRIASVKSVPWIIFRHVGLGIMNVERLSRIWEVTFDRAYSSIISVQLDHTTTVAARYRGLDEYLPTPGEGIIIRVLGSQPRKPAPTPADEVPNPPAPPCYSRALFDILAPLLSTYLPKHNWTSRSLHLRLNEYNQEFPSHPTTEEWYYVVLSMVLATAYAACCKSLHANSGVGLASGLVEMAIPPDLASDKLVREWI